MTQFLDKLAAIVGDGRSTAAQILQVCGLTFDEAIRALQSALAHPRDVPAPLPAEDVLARARERVQSRAAPSLRDIMRDLPMAPRQPALPPAGQGFPDLVPAPPSYDFGEANAAPAPAGPLPAQNEPAPPPAPLDVALAQVARQRVRVGGGDAPAAKRGGARPGGVLGDRERLTELSKLISSLRYGLEVHDGSMVQSAEERMRKVARHLPGSFRAMELIKHAADPGERSARLAELFLQRCFRLLDEDYAAVGEIERQIAAV